MVGGSESTWRESTHSRGEHAYFTQKGQQGFELSPQCFNITQDHHLWQSYLNLNWLFKFDHDLLNGQFSYNHVKKLDSLESSSKTPGVANEKKKKKK